eukprot:TRINITY_DN2690_c0_g1_i1.p1 TRINITY_DN2690_c0_g1~~TRINITY_DN2690_c0_g1_i1.p1  ORF type:complete len:769 (-),score=70.14 TRINITY_DN2690_c0_g1_i1:1633-3939(-)
MNQVRAAGNKEKSKFPLKKKQGDCSTVSSISSHSASEPKMHKRNSSSPKGGLLSGKRKDSESPASLSSQSIKAPITPIERGEVQIFVDHLPQDATEEEIVRFFSHYGTVLLVKIQCRRHGQPLKAFVTFATAEEAARAKEANGTKFNGQSIVIKKAFGWFLPGPHYQQMVYVGNLAHETTHQSLREFLKGCGHVVSMKIFKDYKGRSREYGCVEFDSEEGAKKAMALTGTMLEGKKIYINYWTPTHSTKESTHTKNASESKYRGKSELKQESKKQGKYESKEKEPHTSHQKKPQLPKEKGRCEKHPSSEVTHYCYICDQLFCFDCCLNHHSKYPDHNASCLQDIVLTTVTKLEERKKDNSYKELKDFRESLAQKLIAIGDIIENMKLEFIDMLNSVATTQKSIIEQAIKDCKTLTPAQNSPIGNKSSKYSDTISVVKQLYADKDFHELVRLYRNLSVEAHDSTFCKLPVIQLEDPAKLQAKFSTDLKVLLTSLHFVTRGCTLCSKAATDILVQPCTFCQAQVCNACGQKCEKCVEFVCKSCMETCSKCMKVIGCPKCNLNFGCAKCKVCKNCMKPCFRCGRTVCMKCHIRCGVKYVWCNGSDKQDRSKSEHTLISSLQPLPTFFRAELSVTGFAARMCWTIGISSKKFDGTDEYKLGKRSNPMLGCVMGMQWKEYGWGPCSCTSKCANGIYTGNYGKAVENGRLVIMLDKNRNLLGEIDGVSQGVIEEGVPEEEYYLTFSAKQASGEIRIVSVEELYQMDFLFVNFSK